MYGLHPFFAAALLLWASHALQAQDGDLSRAQQLLAGDRHQEAADLFGELVAESPDDGRAWLGLAKSLHELGRGEEALDAMARAASAGALPASVALHGARIHAARGDLEAVRSSLQDLADTGAKVWGQIKATAELAPLLDEPELQAVLVKLQPCAADPFRQFDFWLGEWTVRPDSGGPAGHNVISRHHEGCLLEERYRNGPYTGSSYNFYDPDDEQWHQLWIDNTGLVLRLAGSWDGERMQLSSETSRITWTPNPDGTVRQLWEQTRDGGETWSTVFDGLYIQRESRGDR